MSDKDMDDVLTGYGFNMDNDSDNVLTHHDIIPSPHKPNNASLIVHFRIPTKYRNSSSSGNPADAAKLTEVAQLAESIMTVTYSEYDHNAHLATFRGRTTQTLAQITAALYGHPTVSEHVQSVSYSNDGA